MQKRGTRFITTFGLGFMKPASGTWGSLPPAAFACAYMLLFPAGSWGDASADEAARLGVYNGVLLLTLVLFSAACVLQGDAAEARFGRKDPSQVVADETAGMCLPLLFLPGAALARPALVLFTVGFAFVCFRVLDIVKPWPARGLQRVPGGWGILIDDLIAGVYAAAVVQGCIWWTLVR